MQPRFEHFILTRFNLATAGKESRLRSDPRWLQQRFDLFERYCLPSVMAQTKQRFRWLVFFEIDTPDNYKQRIEALVRRCPRLEPQWVDTKHGPTVFNLIRQQLGLAAPFLLTTRLDNDDALAADFVERLQASITAPVSAPVFLNFPVGFNYRDRAIYLDNDYSNAFVSCFEPSLNFGTVWARQHHLVAQAGAVRQLDQKPMWLQVIHGRNVSNRVRGKRVAKEFVSGFDDLAGLVLAPTSSWVMCLDGYLLFPLRRLRESLRAGLKKIVQYLR